MPENASGNLSVFPQKDNYKFGAAGVLYSAGFVVKYIQSIYKQQNMNDFDADLYRCVNYHLKTKK